MMTKEQVETTVRYVKKAVKGDKTYFWRFLAGDAEGHPALFVDKIEADVKAAYKQARKTATDKTWAAGTLQRDPGGSLVFAHADGTVKPNVLQREIHEKFSKLAGLELVRGVLRGIPVVALGTPRKPGKGVAPEAPPGDRLTRLGERLVDRERAFRAAPETFDDERMGKLLLAIEEYRALGGTEDLVGLTARVSGERRGRALARDALPDVARYKERLDQIGREEAVNAEELTAMIEAIRRLRAAVVEAVGS